MYIDLVRAYLREYGKQSGLARAIGVTEAYLSFLLEPFHPYQQRRQHAYWDLAIDMPPHGIVETLKYLKTPSPHRAKQLAELLCTQPEQYAFLLHHLDLARRRHPPSAQPSTRLCRDEIEEALRKIGNLHAVALHGTEPHDTHMAYAHVWGTALQVLEGIDPKQYPLEYAQALMFLHDAASVSNR